MVLDEVMQCFLSRWVQAFDAPVFVHLMTTGFLTLKHGSSKQMNHSTVSLSIRRTRHWLRKDVVFLRSLIAAPLMIAGKMPALMKFLIQTATMSPRSASLTSSCVSSSTSSYAFSSSISTGTKDATSPSAVMLLDSTTWSSDQAMMCIPTPTYVATLLSPRFLIESSNKMEVYTD